MAETTQLLQQAKAGQFSMEGLRQFAKQGTPNINQPQAAPDVGGGDFMSGLRAFAKQQQPAQPQAAPMGGGLPVAETVPATPEQLAGPSLWKDMLKPSIQDAAHMAVTEALPTGLGIAGGIAGSVIPGAGTVAGAALGASVGSALGTYLNDAFGIDESTAMDYALNAGIPLAGGVVAKTGKAVLKRLPAFAEAQQKYGAKIARTLTKDIMKRPEDALVKQAWQTLDNLMPGIPTAPLQQAVTDNLERPALAFLRSKMKNLGPQFVQAIDDPTKTLMKPTELQRFNRFLKENITDLYKKGDAVSTQRATQLGKVRNAIEEQIDRLAATGDQGAAAIKRASTLTKQQKMFDNIDDLMESTITRKLEKGTGNEIIETNVNKIWDKVNKAERILQRGGNPTDDLGRTVRELMQNPEGYKTFKDGLKQIAKFTPDGSIRLISEKGGGLLERGVRNIGKELNTGALTRLLSTQMGQEIMTRTLAESGGRLTMSSLAGMTALLRPTLTGLDPKADPAIAELVGLLEEGKALNQQYQQHQANQKARPTE